MKLLTAVLLLALLAGSQASPLCEELKPKLEEVEDAILRYVSQAIEETMELIQKSELGQEIEQWELYPKTEDFFQELANKLPPQAQEWLRNMGHRAHSLVFGIAIQLSELERKALPYEQQLQATLQSYAEEPLETAEQYVKTLLGSHVSGIIPSGVELQEKLGSYAHELGLQEVQHGLAVYARDLRQTLSPYSESLRGWLTSHWDSLMQWFQ